MSPFNINLNPHTPTWGDVITLFLLTVALIILAGCSIYIEGRKRGQRTTCLQSLRLGLIWLKTASVQAIRFFLLFLAIVLPLMAVSGPTVWYAIFMNLWLTGGLGQSPSTLAVGIAYTVLLSLAIGMFVFYFLNKYGAVYKLAMVYFGRNDVKQYLNKRSSEMYLVLTTINIVYIYTIIVLLVSLTSIPSVLPRMILGTFTALLLTYVVFNKKYYNAISLVEKICRKVKCNEA